MERTLDAVVFAGGHIEGRFARESGETVKALIEFGGTSCITRVTAGLLACPRIGRVAVVGTERLKLRLPIDPRVLFASERSGAIENILVGLDILGVRGTTVPVLVCPGDLPLLNPGSIAQMIDVCPDDAAVGISLVPRWRIEAEQPGAPYTYIRSRDGQFSNACPAIIRGSVVDSFRRLLEEFHSSRKSQFMIARRIGLVTVVRFLFGRLTLHHAAAVGEKLFGAKVHLDANGSAELSLDVDDVPEFRYIRAHWDALAGGPPPSEAVAHPSSC